MKSRIKCVFKKYESGFFAEVYSPHFRAGVQFDWWWYLYLGLEICKRYKGIRFEIHLGWLNMFFGISWNRFNTGEAI